MEKRGWNVGQARKMIYDRKSGGGSLGSVVGGREAGARVILVLDECIMAFDDIGYPPRRVAYRP